MNSVPSKLLAGATALIAVTACARSVSTNATTGVSPSNAASAPNPDPRVGLKAGQFDAAEATWNMRVLSETKPSAKFMDKTNSDLAFSGPYAIQGSYAGYQIWDISNPKSVSLKSFYYCPQSQSDVSVYKNLLITSGEGTAGRMDCGENGIKDTVSKDRLLGIRIYDISDIANPKAIVNVQTCRGSHTHTLVVDPNDHDNVYVYISGSSGLRSPTELAGCVSTNPTTDPNSALFRIEVIKIPLAHPEQAAVVSSGRIFDNLAKEPHHGQASADVQAVAEARAQGKFTVNFLGDDFILPDRFSKYLLDSLVKSRGGSGEATKADSDQLRRDLPEMARKMMGEEPNSTTYSTHRQCHDITVYPAIGLAGGACEGYGMLLDIHDVQHPRRLDAVSDSNFAYWHSATFNNDGTKLLFSDEWGGGGAPKCRATDPRDWGADAIYTIDNGKLHFQSYYKLPAPQTKYENCVAHNGSLIPIPGRDVMAQAWYQGGISVFDWTDAAHPKEIAFFDRGPVDSTRMGNGGEWSAYWYNGVIVGSEISRGLDVLELTPNPLLTQNEIDAAKTVKWAELNVQGQPKMVWPPSFALARAYLDQLQRSGGLSADRLAAARGALASAEKVSGAARRDALTGLATSLDNDASSSSDGNKVRKLQNAVRDLATATVAQAGPGYYVSGEPNALYVIDGKIVMSDSPAKQEVKPESSMQPMLYIDGKPFPVERP
ncbi:MAG TPA: hypothetical protein VK733_03980 [Gemmatimonadaceae bacterium]|nr:hypothetical protein [Gemmatimonadaceae bacterium]